MHMNTCIYMPIYVKMEFSMLVVMLLKKTI